MTVRMLQLLALLPLAALLTLARAADAQARSLDETFALGVEAYTQGLNTEHRDPRLEQFRRAQRLFESLAEQGVRTPDLFTNLGNAALQAEDLGAAVLAYRRALALDADAARALQNLEHARSLLPAWVPRPEPAGMFDSLFAWHRTIPALLRERIAAACFAVMALLVAASIRFGQSGLRNAAILPGLAWLAVIGAGALDRGGESGEGAVVTSAEAVARVADSPLAPSAFPQPLPAGAEVRVLETRAPWLQVRLANGRDAWVKASSLTRVAYAEDAGDGEGAG